MPRERRVALAENLERFDKLDPAEQAAIRKLDAQIAAQGPGRPGPLPGGPPPLSPLGQRPDRRAEAGPEGRRDARGPVRPGPEVPAQGDQEAGSGPADRRDPDRRLRPDRAVRGGPPAQGLEQADARPRRPRSRSSRSAAALRGDPGRGQGAGRPVRAVPGRRGGRIRRPARRRRRLQEAARPDGPVGPTRPPKKAEPAAKKAETPRSVRASASPSSSTSRTTSPSRSPQKNLERFSAACPPWLHAMTRPALARRRPATT